MTITGATLRALLPPGQAFNEATDSNLADLLDGLADEFNEMETALLDFIETEIFPDTTDGLLTEWESESRLDEETFGGSRSDTQRRADLIARLASYGNASIPALQTLATNLGFAIQIEEHYPAIAGMSYAGMCSIELPGYFGIASDGSDGRIDGSTAGTYLTRHPPQNWVIIKADASLGLLNRTRLEMAFELVRPSNVHFDYEYVL